MSRSAIQGRMPVPNERLDLRVEPELPGYYTVSYRIVVDGIEHRDQWHHVEHTTDGEVEDVLLSVWATWANDREWCGL